MDEGSLFISMLISSIIGLTILYFIIKNAVFNALEMHDKRATNNNQKTEWILTNILIKLGGNPNDFSKLEELNSFEFEEARKKLAKSNISNTKYEIARQKLKNQYAEKLNELKMETISNS